MTDKTDASGLAGEGEKVSLDSEGRVKELPAALEKRVGEFVEWANLDRAYEILNNQDEHNSLVIASSENNPSPHKDMAIVIEKASSDVNIMIACKVFNTDTDEYLEESKTLTIKIPREKLADIIKMEE